MSGHSRGQVRFERAELEIGHAEYLLPLLLERQKVSNLAEVGIIFDADKTVLAEIAREPCRRQEIGLAECAEPNVDDRIDDEFPFLVAHADDRPDFGRKMRLRELRCLVAELEINAIEKFLLAGCGTAKRVRIFAPLERKAPLPLTANGT